MKARACLALLTLALAGCDTTSCERSGLDCPGPGSSDVDVVAGVDLAALFARPTGAEIEGVLSEWRGGPTPEQQVAFRDVALYSLGNRESISVLAGAQADESAAVVYAAVRQPPRPAGDVRTLPLVLVLGDTPGADVETMIRDLALPDGLKDEVVLVFLAYRGGTLRVQGETYSSGVPADPYAGDGEDAWALLAYLASRSPASAPYDAQRLAIIGHGRGGSVALLEAARAKVRTRAVPRLVLSLAAPASFFTPTSRFAARQYLLGNSPGTLPAVESVMQATAGAVRSGEATLAEARVGLVRRSASWFFMPPRLPAPPYIVAAYGEADIVVPIEDGRALDFLTGQPDRGLYFELENTGHQSIQANDQVLSTTRAEVCARLFTTPPRACL